MQLVNFLPQYDCLLVPGEQAVFSDHPHAVSTAPWLIRDADELLPEQESRRMLKVRSDHVPVVAVIGCGKHEEIKELRELASALTSQLAERAEVRFITPLAHTEGKSGKHTSACVDCSSCMAVLAGHTRRFCDRGKWRVQYGARSACHRYQVNCLSPEQAL